MTPMEIELVMEVVEVHSFHARVPQIKQIWNVNLAFLDI